MGASYEAAEVIKRKHTLCLKKLDMDAESNEEIMLSAEKESGDQNKNSEERSRWKSSKPTPISLVKDVKDHVDILTSPIKSKNQKKRDFSSPPLRQSPHFSPAKVLPKENSSSDDLENPISKAFKMLDWSKLVPENTGWYTILVGKTPVTLIVQAGELPVGHSSPKSIDSNTDLKTDDTRSDQSTNISQKQIVKQFRKCCRYFCKWH